jgi:glyoxylase-like metal-dependent hydrolase (beta-lactamase superfamily II)
LLQNVKEIIKTGDKSGNGMIARFRLPSGLDIFGLPAKNFYAGDWDLGPTWNFAVMADEPFLVDSGRYGQGGHLINAMSEAGIESRELKFVLISHGHEDHDGGLAEFLNATQLRVKAHTIYDLTIRKYPRKAPEGAKEDFPAKCWHCVMPEEFYSQNCLEYHKVLHDLKVETIGDGVQELGNGIKTHHLPGHSPDCLAVQIGDEAILVGDVILPDITPWPTMEAQYGEIAEVINHLYKTPSAVFGLTRYLKSLKKLSEIAEDHPDILVLPAHRLYYNDQWNSIQLGQRVHETIQHHADRCSAILDIVGDGVKSAEEITEAHFEEHLLKGQGRFMAMNEIKSHCELLVTCGDLIEVEENRYEGTGRSGCGKYIQSLKPDTPV